MCFILYYFFPTELSPYHTLCSYNVWRNLKSAIHLRVCSIYVVLCVDAFYVQVNRVFLSCEVLSFLHTIIPHTYSLLSLVYKIPQLSVKSATVVHTQTTTHVCSVVFVHVMAMPCQLKKRASDHKMTDGSAGKRI